MLPRIRSAVRMSPRTGQDRRGFMGERRRNENGEKSGERKRRTP